MPSRWSLPSAATTSMAPAAARHADLTLRTEPVTLTQLLRRTTAPDDALASGALQLERCPYALDHFLAAFALGPDGALQAPPSPPEQQAAAHCGAGRRAARADGPHGRPQWSAPSGANTGMSRSSSGSSITGVPWVWKLRGRRSPHAWPLDRSACVQVIGSQSGAKIR
jgi:hypothetical protein